MPDLDEFLDRLASKAPVPGGGSVAALEVALGYALLTMVCDLTFGKPAYAKFEDELMAIREAATKGRERARRLVDEDEMAFELVSQAMKLPRVSEEEKAQRREAVQKALHEAVQPPLSTMREASKGIGLAGALVLFGNKSAVSDVGSAALAFAAGFSSARLNVEINLASIKDEAFVRECREVVAQIGAIESRVAEVEEAVTEVIGGSA